MGFTDMACYITVGVPEDDMSDFVELEQSFYQSFNDLAEDFFSNVADNIIQAFLFAVENPLCIALVSCLLVVLAFRLIPFIFNVFRGRG